MRLLITLPLLLLTTAIYGQDKTPQKFKHHEIQLSLGSWAAAVHTNFNLKPGGASGTDAAFEYRYYHKSPFGAGISIETAKVQIKNDDDTTLVSASAQFLKLGFNFRYNLVNKPKFLFFIGTSHLANAFAYQRENVNNTKSEINAKGFQHALNLGINWYFSKTFGLFSDIRWQIQSVRVTEYKYDGKAQDYLDYIPSKDVFFNFTGLGLRLGVSLRF
jgi:hypothetical protein